MNRRARHTVLICLFVGLVAFLLLSLSLSDLELRPGAPIPGAAQEDSSLRDAMHVSAIAAAPLPLPGVIVGALLIALLVYVMARLVGLVDPRRIAAIVLGLLLLIGLVNLLPRIAPGPPALQAEESSAAAATRSQVYVRSPLGQAPSAFRWLAAGCLLVGAGAFAALLLNRPPKTDPALDSLAQSAEDALRNLAAGKSFSSVIIDCYLQMSEVIHAEQDIQRPREMTAHEFLAQLEMKGLPPEPVHRLTLLFEKARYGAEPMSRSDEDSGRECLRQVVQYCRAEGPEG